MKQSLPRYSGNEALGVEWHTYGSLLGNKYSSLFHTTSIIVHIITYNQNSCMGGGLKPNGWRFLK